MKLLSAALKMGSAFESADKIAEEYYKFWMDKTEQQVKAEAEEYGQTPNERKNEWLDHKDDWDRKIKALRDKIVRFQVESRRTPPDYREHSPILRFEHLADSQGKVFIGFSSPQAKGYRIVLLNYPVWLETLFKTASAVWFTENLTESAVYALVSGDKLNQENLSVLNTDFWNDLEAAGVPAFEKTGYVTKLKPEFVSRFEKAINRQLPFDVNVLRVDALVQQIKREYTLAVPAAPGRLAVGPPPSPIRTPAVVPAPEMGRRLEDWYLMYAPHLRTYSFNYLYRSSWDQKTFNDLIEAKSFLEQGKGRLYIHAYRMTEDAVWHYPVPLTDFKLQVGKRWENWETDGKHLYHLQQPTWNGIQWIWRVTNVYQYGNIQRQTDLEVAESQLLNNKYGYVTPTPEPKPEPIKTVSTPLYTTAHVTPPAAAPAAAKPTPKFKEGDIVTARFSPPGSIFTIKKAEFEDGVWFYVMRDMRGASPYRFPEYELVLTPPEEETEEEAPEEPEEEGAWKKGMPLTAEQIEDAKADAIGAIADYDVPQTALLYFDQRGRDAAIQAIKGKLSSWAMGGPDTPDLQGTIKGVWVTNDVMTPADAAKASPSDAKLITWGEMLDFILANREMIENNIQQSKATSDEEAEEEAKLEQEAEEDRELKQEPDITVYMKVLVEGGVVADEKGNPKLENPQFTLMGTTYEEFAKHGSKWDTEGMWSRPIIGMFGTQNFIDILKDAEVEYDAVEDNAITWGNDWEAIREALADNPAPFNKYADFHIKWRPEDLSWEESAKQAYDIYNYRYPKGELVNRSRHQLQVIAKIKGLDISGDEGALIDRILAFVPGVTPEKKEVPTPTVPVEKPVTRPAAVTQPTAATPVTKPMAPLPPVKPTRVLSTEDMRRLQDHWNTQFFRALGKVPANISSVFRVEFEGVKLLSFEEAKGKILAAADDIIGEIRARQTVTRAERIPPQLTKAPAQRPQPRTDRELEEENEEGGGFANMGNVPPASFPPAPLSILQPFPRGPTSEEKLQLWRVFCFQMREKGFNCDDFQRPYDDYIEKSQFLSWEDLHERFKFIVETLKAGQRLPPLVQWRARLTTPTGLRGELRELEPSPTPAKLTPQQIEDEEKNAVKRQRILISHWAAVLIHKARYYNKPKTMHDLYDEVVDRAIIDASIPEEIFLPIAKEAIRAIYSQPLRPIETVKTDGEEEEVEKLNLAKVPYVDISQQEIDAFLATG